MVGAADGILRSERFADGHVPESSSRLGERWVSKVVNGFLAGPSKPVRTVIVVDPWGVARPRAGGGRRSSGADPTLFCP